MKVTVMVSLCLVCCRTRKLHVCCCISWRLEAAGQALKAALAGLSAEPTAAESGDARESSQSVMSQNGGGRAGCAYQP